MSGKLTKYQQVYFNVYHVSSTCVVELLSMFVFMFWGWIFLMLFYSLNIIHLYMCAFISTNFEITIFSMISNIMTNLKKHAQKDFYFYSRNHCFCGFSILNCP